MIETKKGLGTLRPAVLVVEEVILVTAVKTIRTAVDAIKLGAFDYITRPFDVAT